MDKLLVLNGKSYKAADFDVNMLCDFEDAGISIGDGIDKKMFSVVRRYAASCMNTDLATAGDEVSAHIKNGGSLDEIFEVFTKAVEESGFFRSTKTDEEQTTSKGTRKKKSESEDVIS